MVVETRKRSRADETDASKVCTVEDDASRKVAKDESLNETEAEEDASKEIAKDKSLNESESEERVDSDADTEVPEYEQVAESKACIVYLTPKRIELPIEITDSLDNNTFRFWDRQTFHEPFDLEEAAVYNVDDEYYGKTTYEKAKYMLKRLMVSKKAFNMLSLYFRFFMQGPSFERWNHEADMLMNFNLMRSHEWGDFEFRSLCKFLLFMTQAKKSEFTVYVSERFLRFWRSIKKQIMELPPSMIAGVVFDYVQSYAFYYIMNDLWPTHWKQIHDWYNVCTIDTVSVMNTFRNYDTFCLCFVTHAQCPYCMNKPKTVFP